MSPDRGNGTPPSYGSAARALSANHSPSGRRRRPSACRSALRSVRSDYGRCCGADDKPRRRRVPCAVHAQPLIERPQQFQPLPGGRVGPVAPARRRRIRAPPRHCRDDSSRDTVSPSLAVTIRPSRALTGSKERACIAERAKPSGTDGAPTPVGSPVRASSIFGERREITMGDLDDFAAHGTSASGRLGLQPELSGSAPRHPRGDHRNLVLLRQRPMLAASCWRAQPLIPGRNN